MVRDENFVVELVCSYMNSTTYQKFFVHDRFPLMMNIFHPIIRRGINYSLMHCTNE